MFQCWSGCVLWDEIGVVYCVGMEMICKLVILVDVVKYDVFCVFSGVGRCDLCMFGGIGSIDGVGICYSYMLDGCCVLLLKILFINFCIYDCVYCVNCVFSNVLCVCFSVVEVVVLMMDFYKCNYIEGLFFFSGIICNVDYMMEQMVEVVCVLCEEYCFVGYIYFKIIFEVLLELLVVVGWYVDCLLINIELLIEIGLVSFVLEKLFLFICGVMGELCWCIEEVKQVKVDSDVGSVVVLLLFVVMLFKCVGVRCVCLLCFVLVGQSMQMIVGVDGVSDQQIFSVVDNLYGNYWMCWVYYFVFSLIFDVSCLLLLQVLLLVCEYCLYQVDWLLCFYGYVVEEIIDIIQGGMLDLDIDFKMVWVICYFECFLVDFNVVFKDMLLCVFGLGVCNVKWVLMVWCYGWLCVVDVVCLCVLMCMLLLFV